MVQAVEAAEAALRKNGESPFELAAFERFFHELYWAQGEEARDKYRMAELLGIGIEGRRKGDPFDFRFRTAAERFRMIEQDEETLIVPYDRTAREAIEALRRFGPSRHLLRRLQPFTVPIERSVMAKLRGSLAVEDLGGVTVLKREAGLYDDDVGLDVERLGGPGIEDLIL